MFRPPLLHKPLRPLCRRFHRLSSRESHPLNTNLNSLAPMQGIPGPPHQPAWITGPTGEQRAGGTFHQHPVPSGAPSPRRAVSSFLKWLMTSFCPSGEWEKGFVLSSPLGRRQGTAFHTPPRDADDSSPPRTVSHDLFLCSYVTSEANLGSTGSTTIQTVFPHVRAGEDSHLAIVTAPHVTQADTSHNG